MGYQAARGISAPPEVVFSTLTDPERLAGWVPPELRAQARAHRVSLLPERMRVEWQPSDGDGWTGALQVRQAPAGGTHVEVTVEPAGASGGEERVRSLVDAALTELDREVADNLTAG